MRHSSGGAASGLAAPSGVAASGAPAPPLPPAPLPPPAPPAPVLMTSSPHPAIIASRQIARIARWTASERPTQLRENAPFLRHRQPLRVHTVVLSAARFVGRAPRRRPS